jgi:DNA polymerase V
MPFLNVPFSATLPHQTSDTAELIRHACPLLAAIHRPGPAYVKCGVILTELSPQGQAQAGLFGQPDIERSTRLMQAIDRINAELGRGSLNYAGSGLNRSWAAAASMESQHFTTDWRQVLQIRA